MHVPVQLRARIESRVDVWEEVTTEGRCDVFVRKVIQRKGEGYFVEVQRQRAQVEGVCYRLYVLDEVLRALKWEGVVHCGGRAAYCWRLLSMLVGGAVSGVVVWGA